MILKDDFTAIAELDLDPIKVKLMHKESGEGWTLAYANAIEAEYRRFLYLSKIFPGEPAAPLFDVDVFWHYHILDTLKYMADCDKVFGHYLHHFPYVGLRGEGDMRTHMQAGVRMQELYEETFGEPYPCIEKTGASRTSFCEGVGAEGAGHASKTAFSWVAPPERAADSRTAFSWVIDPPSNGRHMQRPTLAPA